MPQSQPSRICFGEFVFDLDEQRLSGKDGELALSPKALAVLAMLVRQPGQIVSKEEILGEVWNETAVTDDALVQRILEVRKALNDDSRSPRFLRTHHKRGYEFIGAPTHPAEAPLLRRGKSRYWIYAAAVTASIAAGALLWMRPGDRPQPTYRIRQLTSLGGMEDYASFDPTGKRVLFASEQDGVPSLQILDVDTGEWRVWLRDAGGCSEPDWSPSGEWAAFRSEREGGAIVLQSLRGNSTTIAARFGHHPRWSADSAGIVFHSEGPGGQIFVWRFNDPAPRAVKITAPRLSNIFSPAWNHDGTRIFFIAAGPVEARSTGKQVVSLGHQVWSVPPEGGQATLATPGLGLVHDGGMEYDRTRPALFFIGLDHNLWRLPVDAATGVSRGQPQRLTFSTEGHQHPRVSARGAVAFSTIPSPEALYYMPTAKDGSLDAKRAERLSGTALARGPTLSPDGRRMAYYSWRGDRFEIWSLDLATRQSVRISPNDGFSRTDPVWSRGGLELVYTVMGDKILQRRIGYLDQSGTRLREEKSVWTAGGAPAPTARNGRFDVSPAGEITAAGAPAQLPPMPAMPQGAVNPVRSADGKRIYFYLDRDGWFNLWSFTTAGQPRQLTFFRGAPFVVSDINLIHAPTTDGVVASLRENRSDLWMLRPD